MDIQSIMKKATAAVEFMYDKTATIKRQMPIVKETGADGMDWLPVHENVPCRLSNSGLNNASQEVANIIQYDVKLFLSSEYDVKAGDVVIVNGDEYESAKEPFVYVSHQEVLLVRKGYA
ncbi:DUF3599 family protein [Cytobacillus firmus]|uniref:DUF3599 family protein n=1 Tax=Cytobacillus firmus TaxID=1399 RepID=UPI0018CEB86C|nr:DUF3599 family protein [Cytobacillus firmus]MBG9548344.1 hypothetical protein [Cytobacillus firmus]MBG9600806.1 hypothetical protein [Cytobacillus firmus]MBG9657824.1 hypothetical protein [Cytobacillus firmus]MED1904826.1 DUF3599 family protein [Cytobacillus firmus]MED1938938.1 DUF3599 family protein [Cytobacillus firmus]